MIQQKIISRLIVLLLLFAVLLIFVPLGGSAADTLQEKPIAKTAEAAQERAYYDVCKSIPHFDDCNSMQGMAVLGEFIYTVKKNSADNKAVIFRTNRFNGTTVQMSFDGAQTVDYLGHANDMCAAQIGADSYLFATSMKKSLGALACYKISNTGLTMVGIYNVYTAGGSNLTISGLDVYEVKGNAATLLLAQGDLVFMGTIDVTAPAGNIYCPLGFQVDKNQMLQIARQACGMPELEMTVQGSGFANDTYYMPLTLHHNHSTQIKPDNHADSTSVIVAFPNIADAITVMDRSVQASLSESIYIPDAGEMFFEIESVDFADGILYFSTNRVRIDHSLTTVSLLLDPGVDVGIFTRRASFRQDGIYMLGGANATDHFLYDPGAADKHLEGGKYPASINTYFGLESNEEGYYYIRSMLTKEYLTVNADCTVTKSAKKENDPSQLFCLTQVYWPNEPGHVAIISMLNYQYLNNEAGTTKGITTTSGKTYRLKKVKDTATLESYLFDYTLYTACYPEDTAGMTEAQAKAHFTSTGKAKGYVASVFFDPEYYLASNPDVAVHSTYGSLQGAYTHFLEYGFWEGRQGSLYYSINEYLHSGNDRLKTGDYPDKLFYIRHFRQYGANESLTRADRYGSDEFAIKEIVAEFGLTPASGYAFLVDYISRNVRLSNVKTQGQLEKLLFDWQYYISKHPGLTESAVASFAGSTYAEKLHSHWVQYGIKEGRTASPYFDAAFYLANYTDVGTSCAEAYTHFVTKGFWKERAGSEYYDGSTYLYGLNPPRQEVCEHIAAVTTKNAPTCTVNGAETTYCCFCSMALKTVVLPAKGHTEVIDKAVAATCTAAGKTEGKRCSVCNTVLVAQQTVPAMGHTDTSPKDNRCDTCGARIALAALRYRTISLKGNIAVNYYMDLEDSVAQDETAYMLFTLEDGEQIKVPATEGIKALYQKNYYYVFSCPMTAKEMADIITCQFFYGEEETQAYTYSVKTYADNILASNAKESLRNLLYAMLNYGAASQIHFEYHTDRLANEGLEVPDYRAVSIDGFPINKDQGTALARFEGASLLLTSETALRIFVKVDASVETFSASYNGKILPLGQRNGLYYADIPNISAKDLDEYFTMVISDGTETAEISYAPMSYCASILANVNDLYDRELQDCVAAMYLYNQAANVYFAN